MANNEKYTVAELRAELEAAGIRPTAQRKKTSPIIHFPPCMKRTFWKKYLRWMRRKLTG